MPNALDHLLLTALALCAYGAFVLFACATERHWNELSGQGGDLPDRSRRRWSNCTRGCVGKPNGLPRRAETRARC